MRYLGFCLFIGPSMVLLGAALVAAWIAAYSDAPSLTVALTAGAVMTVVGAYLTADTPS